MTNDNGGPAFPIPAGPVLASGDLANWPERGMSLRDWFAGQALAAIVGNNEVLDASVEGVKVYDNMLIGVARYSYALADAMLAIRTRKFDRSHEE